MATVREFRMPDLGEGLVEATIASWRVSTGDDVSLNDIIAEVETEKSTVDLPSPYAGTVVALLAEEGESVPVGNAIIQLRTEGDGDEPRTDPIDDIEETTNGATAPKVARDPGTRARSNPVRTSEDVEAPAVLVGQRPTPDTPLRRRRRRTGLVQVPMSGAQSPAVQQALPPSAVVTSPLVRRAAMEKNIDLSKLLGTGPGGRITRADVDAVHHAYIRPSAGSAGTEVGRVAGNRVRKATAKQMTRSAQIPQASVWASADVTETAGLLQDIRGDDRFPRISLFGVICLATLRALKKVVVLNARWDEESESIIYRERVDLSLAVATERGLVAPSLEAAESLAATAITDSIDALVDRCRTGKSLPPEVKPGTFTITNIGATSRVACGTPLLNPPQSGILAIGHVHRRPWMWNGEIAARDVLEVALTVDHRIVDGAEAGEFLDIVCDYLEHPGKLFLALLADEESSE